VICPYCRRQANISDIAKTNMESYGNTVRALSKCCGKILTVRPRVTFSCSESNQSAPDDWGYVADAWQLERKEPK